MMPPTVSVADWLVSVEPIGAIGVAFGGVTGGIGVDDVAAVGVGVGVLAGAAAGAGVEAIGAVDGDGVTGGAGAVVGAAVVDGAAVAGAAAVDGAVTAPVLTSSRSFWACALVGSKFRISFSP